MAHNTLKAAAAMAAFGLFHSALASGTAKRAAGSIFGERARNGLYRPFYLGQSVITTVALARYIRGLPNREIYHVKGPLSWLMRGGQLAGITYMAWGANTIGLTRMTGIEGMQALVAGQSEVPPEPEAHGPAESDGKMQATGPFKIGRHPMNLAFVPILWLNPRMSDNLLAFNLVATAYLILGSKHEEIRLKEVYGNAYTRYQESGVPFFLPGPRR